MAHTFGRIGYLETQINEVKKQLDLILSYREEI
jgi:hypothetical protein